MNHINVAVASNSALKLASVSEVLQQLDVCKTNVTGFEVFSGVRKQPEGVETLIGCANRLTSLEYFHLEDRMFFQVAIENGIFTIGNRVFDRAVVMVRDSSGVVISGVSLPVEFPVDVYHHAKAIGFEQITLGEILSFRYGCDPVDPHCYLTNGRYPRKRQLVDALVQVFKKFGVSR